jgi:hypothetical protein
MQHKLWVLGQAVNHEHLQKWYNSKQQLPLCMCCKIENSDVQGLLLRKFNFPGNASNPYPITLVPYIFAAAVLIFRAATERSKIESNWAKSPSHFGDNANLAHERDRNTGNRESRMDETSRGSIFFVKVEIFFFGFAAAAAAATAAT